MLDSHTLMSSVFIGASDVFGKSSGIMSRMQPVGRPPMASGSLVIILVTFTLLLRSGSCFWVISKRSKPGCWVRRLIFSSSYCERLVRQYGW